MFITYLDFLLKEAKLLDHEVLAYADDLVFFAKDLVEARQIVTKLDGLLPFLEVNKKKCGMMEVG